MDKAFLYIDILGFEKLVRDYSEKINEIIEIIDGLDVHRNYALQTVVCFAWKWYPNWKHLHTVV